MSCAISSLSERRLLEAVRRGDEDAFRRLVEPYRPGLRAHCQRMLGSLHDAEDALQDALLRAWRGLGKFEGRSSLGRWLYRLATNASLDALARRRARELPIDFAVPVADAAAGPAASYEQREAVELAVAGALRQLRPRPWAVLVLREGLGLSASETAQVLGTTVASVNSALQRVRKALDERSPDVGRSAVTGRLDDEHGHALARCLVDAFEDGDVEGVVSLVASEAA